MMRLAPLVSAVALVAGACTPGTMEQDPDYDRDVQLFSKVTNKKGGVQKACAELKKLCATKSLGCTAHKTFCSSPSGGGDAGLAPPSGSAAAFKKTICQQIAKACQAGYQLACKLEAQHCHAGGSTTDAGAATDAGGASSAKACCMAVGDCLLNSRCSKAASACASSGARKAVYELACVKLKAASRSSTCCMQLHKCVSDFGACASAVKTCAQVAPIKNVSPSLVKSVCSSL